MATQTEAPPTIFDELTGWHVGAPFDVLFGGDTIECPLCSAPVTDEALLLDMAGLEAPSCTGCGAVLNLTGI